MVYQTYSRYVTAERWVAPVGATIRKAVKLKITGRFPLRLLKQFLKGYLFGIALAVVVILLATYAHCAVGKKHDNSLGFIQYTSNPLMYTAGSLSETQDALSTVDGNLNLRILPLGTYALYDESILLCGEPVDMFNGVTEPFVLVYERTAHRTVQGVGCHVLIEVRSLKPKGMLQ